MLWLSKFVLQIVTSCVCDSTLCLTYAQFVRRMGYQTSKPLVMFRPRGDMEVLKQYPGAGAAQRICPATVCDKLNIGYMVKYWLQTDDGSVRGRTLIKVTFILVCLPTGRMLA